MVQNGDKVRDTVTGFEGIVTGVADYLTGCRQVLISAQSRDGKAGEAGWYDDDRVEIMQAQHTTMGNRERNGGPQSNPAPTR